MARPWSPLPYEDWRETCDTLHAHTQVLGKLAVALALPEPELQHAALRLTTRGWETAPLPLPDRSGTLVALLELHTHEAVLEHSDGRSERIPLTPNRAVGDVTREVLAIAHELAGPFEINLHPQEVSWMTPLDEDEEHRTYEPDRVADYFGAATCASLVLSAVRAPYRGRSTLVNAWWGTFDLAVSLFSGRPAEPPSHDFIMRNSADAQQVEIGWWPGDARYEHPAFFAFASPAPESFPTATLSVPDTTRWDTDLGEYLLDWDDVVRANDPYTIALEFSRSVVAHACTVCEWDPALARSALGDTPPLR